MTLQNFLFILLLISFNNLFAQESKTVVIQIKDNPQEKNFPNNISSIIFNQSEESEFVSQFLNQLYQNGYASASVDSTILKNDTSFVYIYLGDKFYFKSLKLHNDIKPYFKKDFLALSKRKRIFKFSSLENQVKNISDGFDEIGYPFSKVFFEDIYLENDSFSVSINAISGDLVIYDSLNNVQDARLTKRYLQAYTGIKVGNPYKESQVIDIDGLMDRLIFVERTAPTTISFLEDKASVNLYLKNKKMSRFDFILGLLPDPNRNNKMLITGDIGIDLRNPFGIGNRLLFEWKRLQPKSQKLNIFADYPFILGTPLGAEVGLKMDKRDTSFLNVDWNIGLQYWLTGRNYVSFFIDNSQTIVPKFDTIIIKQTKRLPNIQDNTSFLYGVKLLVDQLDYPINPRKGFFINASLGAGIKRIKQNILLEEISDGSDFNYSTLYDSIADRTLKVNIKLQADYYYNLAKNHVLKFSVNGASVINKNLLFNELHRIGGNRLLRGFDEESIPVSTYFIGTLEYRFLLDKNAFFHIFADMAYLETRIDGKVVKDNATGFGAGIAFETKAGIFGLSYALGRTKEISIDPRSSKIHFGYINVF